MQLEVDDFDMRALEILASKAPEEQVKHLDRYRIAAKSDHVRNPCAPPAPPHGRAASPSAPTSIPREPRTHKLAPTDSGIRPRRAQLGSQPPAETARTVAQEQATCLLPPAARRVALRLSAHVRRRPHSPPPPGLYQLLRKRRQGCSRRRRQRVAAAESAGRWQLCAFILQCGSPDAAGRCGDVHRAAACCLRLVLSAWLWGASTEQVSRRQSAVDCGQSVSHAHRGTWTRGAVLESVPSRFGKLHRTTHFGGRWRGFEAAVPATAAAYLSRMMREQPPMERNGRGLQVSWAGRLLFCAIYNIFIKYHDIL